MNAAIKDQKGPLRKAPMILKTNKPKQMEILKRHMAGMSHRDIARELACDKKTVSRVIAVNEPLVEEFVREAKAALVGMIALALGTVGKGVRKDFDKAWKLLQTLGVFSLVNLTALAAGAAESSAAKPDELAKQKLLASLSSKDRLKFDLLEMAEIRAEAYGEGSESIRYSSSRSV